MGPQALADRTANLWQNQVNDWHAPVAFYPTIESTSNTSEILNAAWDGVNGRWLLVACLTSVADLQVYASGDGQDPWLPVADAVQVVGTAIAAGAVVQDGSIASTLYASVLTAGAITLYKNVSGTWSTPAAGSAAAAGGFNDVQLAYYNGRCLEAIAYTGNPGALLVSTDGWATDSSVLPGTPPVVNGWIVRQNGLASGSGGQALLLPSYTGLATPIVYTSPDGTAWTAQTSSLGAIMAATDQIVGCDWSSDLNGAAWFVVVKTTTPSSYILRSPDGINWTKIATLATGKFNGLCAVGGNTLFTAQLANSSYRLAVSPNGGRNWYGSQALVPPASYPVGGNPVLVGSPMQALAASAQGVAEGVSAVRTSVARGLSSVTAIT